MDEHWSRHTWLWKCPSGILSLLAVGMSGHLYIADVYMVRASIPPWGTKGTDGFSP